jgi:hypothetical protein
MAQIGTPGEVGVDRQKHKYHIIQNKNISPKNGFAFASASAEVSPRVKVLPQIKNRKINFSLLGILLHQN